MANLNPVEDDDEAKFSESYYADYAANEMQWLKTYRQRRSQYVSLIREIVGTRPDVRDVVEIGCGVGLFTYALLDHFDSSIRLIAGDTSDHAIAVTRTKLRTFAHARVQKLNAETIDLPADSADMIVVLDVLEHLREPERFAENAFRVLRNGALLLVSTPNPESLGGRIKKERTKDENGEFIWFALRDKTHINIRSMDAWRSLLLQAGFRKVRDGSDFLWDVPYFRRVPAALQKVFFLGMRHVLVRMWGFLPWRLGENYYGIWRKP